MVLCVSSTTNIYYVFTVFFTNEIFLYFTEMRRFPKGKSNISYRTHNNTQSFSHGTWEKPVLVVSEFRKDPVYSMYNNWSRLIVLGIIPFLLLLFFDSKIYTDINERRKRRLRYVKSFYNIDKLRVLNNKIYT